MKRQLTKTLFILAIFCISFSQQSNFGQEEILKVQFEQLKHIYGKQYSDNIEDNKRFSIFVENVKQIEYLNKLYEKQGVKFEINQFFDMSNTEFINQILMPPIENIELNQEIDNSTSVQQQDVPYSFDWREHGAVTSVQNQGSVGTCWAFSTVGNVEGIWKLAGNDLVQLSAEQLVECDSLVNPPDAACGIFGGWPYLGLQYIIGVGGVASNEDYRYCVGVPSKENPCYPCVAPGYSEKYCGPGLYPPACNQEKWHCRDNEVVFSASIDSWRRYSQDENILKSQLFENGPVSVLINASGGGLFGGLQFYKKGVYQPKSCSPKSLNHAVLLVGYGTDTENGIDFWIVKNSWGTKWGEEGYFRIQRGVGMCGINEQAVTGVINKKPEKNNKKEQIELQ